MTGGAELTGEPAPVDLFEVLAEVLGRDEAAAALASEAEAAVLSWLRAIVKADAVEQLGVVVEHGLLMSGGGYHVRNPGAHVEAVYPLQAWIEQELASGSTVRRRAVIVVEDWSDVRGSGDRG